MKGKHIGAMICALTGILAIPASHASSLSNFIDGGKVSGYLRAYEWSNHDRYFSTGTPTATNNTFAIGGQLKAVSGAVDHFSLGAAFYTSHAPGLSYNPDNFEPTLGTNVDTLGEAYLNYDNHSFKARIGRQAIDTPFANSADYRMVPALYEGAVIDYSPFHFLQLTAGRIIRYKSWTSSSFDRTNNDTAGPFQIFPTVNTEGFWYAGLHNVAGFGRQALVSHLWFYDFLNIAHLYFVNEKLKFKQWSTFTPYIGAQYALEHSDGRQLFGDVDAHVYGGQLGVQVGPDGLSAGVIYIPSEPGAFNHGGMASPYTDGYGSAGLYTANMLFPTEGIGSGTALEVSGNYQFSDRWSGWAAYNHFDQTTSSAPARPINEYVASLTYAAAGSLKGLKLMDIFGYATQTAFQGHFVQNRLMLQYNF